MYQFLDIFFIIFHTLFTLFNLVGWIWEKTRRLHLVTLSLTAFSWFVLGIWYGFGYCPCTHWHWIVRRELGHTDMPHSYIKFLVDTLTGLDVNAVLVEWSTGLGFAFAVIMAVYMQVKKRLNRQS